MSGSTAHGVGVYVTPLTTPTIVCNLWACAIDSQPLGDHDIETRQPDDSVEASGFSRSRTDSSAGRATGVITPGVAGSNPARFTGGVAQLAEHDGPSGAVEGRRFEPSPLHHYLVVRTNVPVGVWAAQLAHAAARSGHTHDATTSVVVLAAPHECELHRAMQEAAAAGGRVFPIREPDPPWRGSLMAFGVVPFRRIQHPKIRESLAGLPLLSKETTACPPGTETSTSKP